MRVLLDACVIFPTVMRELLVGLAQKGLFEPLWSERILEEWVRASTRLGAGAEAIALSEAAVMRDQFPQACVKEYEVVGLWLPDENDIHVLAAAIKGEAEILVTNNLGDFPTRILGDHGLLRRAPDGFMLDFLIEHEAVVRDVALDVQRKAETISGREQPLRGLLKRAGLPRLGKALVN